MPQDVEMVDERARFRREGVVEIEHDALVERAEDETVAVALQAFEEPVPDRPFEVGPGAEAVGDQRRERAVVRRQFEDVRRRHVERHQHPLAIARPDRFRPRELRVVVDGRAGRQAQGERIDDAVAAHLAGEPPVAALPIGRVHQAKGRADRLRDFGQRPDDRLAVRRAVAVAGRHVARQAVAVLEKQSDLPGRDARAVEARHRESYDPPPRQSRHIGAGCIGKVVRQAGHDGIPSA